MSAPAANLLFIFRLLGSDWCFTVSDLSERVRFVAGGKTGPLWLLAVRPRGWNYWLSTRRFSSSNSVWVRNPFSISSPSFSISSATVLLFDWSFVTGFSCVSGRCWSLACAAIELTMSANLKASSFGRIISSLKVTPPVPFMDIPAANIPELCVRLSIMVYRISPISCENRPLSKKRTLWSVATAIP